MIFFLLLALTVSEKMKRKFFPKEPRRFGRMLWPSSGVSGKFIRMPKLHKFEIKHYDLCVTLTWGHAALQVRKCLYKACPKYKNCSSSRPARKTSCVLSTMILRVFGKRPELTSSKSRVCRIWNLLVIAREKFRHRHFTSQIRSAQ